MPETFVSISTWTSIVVRIRAGSDLAVEELYKSLRSIRFFFSHQIGPQRAEDAYHSLIIDLVGSIKQGALRQPETLSSYAMTVARRKVSRYIGEMTRERQTQDVESTVLACDASENPEQRVLRLERQEVATRILKALPARNREVLIRFYLEGE